MSLLASFLEEIMNDPPSNLAGEQNTPGATYSTRRANSVGLDEGGQEGSTSEQDVTDSTSEAIRLGLAFAESSMDHHSIDGTIRDNVRRFVGLEPEYQLTELFVVTIALAGARTGNSTATLDFSHSHVFSTHVMNQLRMIVLVPHTMFYVTPLQEWVINHMRDNSAIWKIPEEILANNPQWMQFCSLIRIRLTTIRSQIKGKASVDAYTKGLDINQVMYKIAPNSAAISEAHKARWAWISLSIEEFNTAVESGEYQKEEFWVYIERHLAATKKAIWGNPRLKSDTQRYERFTQLFVVALSKHNLKYPIRRITRGRISSRPAWQAVIEESIGMGREIYATMEKDTEVDEEEGSN
ncbi:hypothetical protein RHS01_08919 [Rhizoctonia solani]|uniref:Uncharacterized protein n=1 Tax=Rhizoctonia solani TaxID=456999 RepID=A0A8H7I7Y5_9AGAM|nr:hypothetical protein RHS01_08919 [Rhizoctonia solani]